MDRPVTTTQISLDGREHRVTFQGDEAAMIEIFVPASAKRGRDGKMRMRGSHWRVLGSSMTSARAAMIVHLAHKARAV